LCFLQAGDLTSARRVARPPFQRSSYLLRQETRVIRPGLNLSGETYWAACVREDPIPALKADLHLLNALSRLYPRPRALEWL
jgi:hypothetical protein